MPIFARMNLSFAFAEFEGRTDQNRDKMTFKRFIAVPIFIIAAAISAISCKKDKEETTTLYLDGTLKMSDVPQYVEAGTRLDLTAAGVTHPEGKFMGVYWRINPEMEKNDTLKVKGADGKNTDELLAFDPVKGASYQYTLGDELQTNTVICGVFAEGYSSSTQSKYVTTVKGGLDGKGSITGCGFETWTRKFTDPRDGKEYYTVTAGGMEWFGQNLAFEGKLTGDDGKSLGCGFPYQSCSAMTDVFGLYYTKEQAKKACPEGWRLSTAEDWLALAVEAAPEQENIDGTSFEKFGTFSGIAGSLMADAKFNGNTMWEYWPQVKITNALHFAAVPAGMATVGSSSKKFEGVKEYSVFWTDADNGDSGLYRYIYVDSPDVQIGEGYPSFAASVRCVRDI